MGSEHGHARDERVERGWIEAGYSIGESDGLSRGGGDEWDDAGAILGSGVLRGDEEGEMGFRYREVRIRDVTR